MANQTTTKYRTFISRIKNNHVEETLFHGLQWIKWDEIIGFDSHIFIKPNFTFPKYKQGVTTTPKLIEALIKILKAKTHNITVGESNGGVNTWTAEESFAGHGLYEICKANNVNLVNLSNLKSEYVEIEVDSKPFGVELPSMLLHDIDVFITLPILKTHVFTKVSLGMKNQWGCIPDAMRLLHHPSLDRGIVALNKVLKTRISIIDAIYGLDGCGPMYGDPVRMDLLIVSNNVAAGDLIGCKLMGIQPETIKHLRIAQKENLAPKNIQDIDVNVDVNQFVSRQFKVTRTPLSWAALLASKSYLLTKLIYDSPLTPAKNFVMGLIRGNSQRQSYG